MTVTQVFELNATCITIQFIEQFYRKMKAVAVSYGLPS